ncbi:hypothetical protein F7R91_37505 [Streptomyces luteolifulvus]|uniref:Integral membrane protein n=1 Tax=Streptomyces luteolifulvus TaxID=2615112 RepID=A0A6H9UQ02_9ACTN|nr:hypothetical protein [Streptomyces luteolifulvus]KAB1140052.1 hypothetical protein F7R91_37505 [Streptomyces luteolifulvus]
MSRDSLRGPVRGWMTGAADALVCLVWAAGVWVALHLQAAPALRAVALFVHLAALILGLGAVQAIDYYGLLWLLGRRSLRQVLDFTGPLHVLVWSGLAGMVISGAVLGLDPASAATRVKLGLVLLVALNGVHAYALHRSLAGQTGGQLDKRLLVRAAISVVVSQAGWWGAAAIGFLNSQG